MATICCVLVVVKEYTRSKPTPHEIETSSSAPAVVPDTVTELPELNGCGVAQSSPRPPLPPPVALPPPVPLPPPVLPPPPPVLPTHA